MASARKPRTGCCRSSDDIVTGAIYKRGKMNDGVEEKWAEEVEMALIRI